MTIKALATLTCLLMAVFALCAAQHPPAVAALEPPLPGTTPPPAPGVPVTPTDPAAENVAPPLTERELLEALNASQKDAPSLTKFPNEDVEKGFKQQGTNPKANQQDNQGNGTTEITAKVGAFDQKGHIAVFTTEVYVENPQFTVNCDKLTAYMHENEVKMDAKAANAAAREASKVPPMPGKPVIAATPKPAPKMTPTPAGAKLKIDDNATSKNATQAERDAVATPPKVLGKSTGGLEEAVCEGNVVLIQDKIDPDGTVTRSIGHGRLAVYYADSGDIYLFGNPDVQQGINTCVSLEDRAIMILNRDGHMTVSGLHRTIIKDSSSDTNKDNSSTQDQ